MNTTLDRCETLFIFAREYLGTNLGGKQVEMGGRFGVESNRCSMWTSWSQIFLIILIILIDVDQSFFVEGGKMWLVLTVHHLDYLPWSFFIPFHTFPESLIPPRAMRCNFWWALVPLTTRQSIWSRWLSTCEKININIILKFFLWPNGNKEKELSARLIQYWTNFIYTG